MLTEPARLPDPVRILLVEDDVLVRIVIAEGLRDAGFTVIESVDTDDARAYLASGSAVDLVFSDIHVPGPVNGLELARQTRADRPGLPIIITSGNAGPAGGGGVGRFLAKPFGIGEAVALVRDMLGLAPPEPAPDPGPRMIQTPP